MSIEDRGIMQEPEYEDSGTVDGILSLVSVHGGYRFRISDYLTGQAIECLVDESMIKEATGSLGKRVEVNGLIGYTRQGFPNRVKADGITPFPAPHEIPHFSELKGILKR